MKVSSPLSFCTTFLQDAAKGQRAELEELNKETEVQVSQLMAWLGEPPDCDVAAVLTALWSFARSFDNALQNVRLMVKKQ